MANDTEISLLIKARDKASKTLKKVTGGMKKLGEHSRAAGVGMGAAGLAGLKLIGDAKKLNAQLTVTAMGLDVTTDELRDLAIDTANVTFPLEEAIASFDLLTRAGERDTEVIQAVATAFDTLGDATGRSASQVTTIMIPAMKTFRLSAEEMAAKTDAMTYMVRNSTISLEDFNTMVGYTDQDMIDAGFTIDDMAAAMIYMSDQGIGPGKVMLKEWNQAVTRSKEEGISMTEALGMTSDELEIYKGKLDGATGMAQEYADAANTQFGIVDKLKHGFSELTLKLGSALEPMEGVFAGMTAMSPVMIAMSTTVGQSAAKWVAHNIAVAAGKVKMVAVKGATIAATAAQWLWNAALTANPIGLVVLAVVALVAGAVALIKNWDKVSAFFEEMWGRVKQTFSKVWGALTETFTAAWDKLKEVWGNVTGFFGRAWDGVVDVFKGAWTKISDFFKGIATGIKSVFEGIINFFIGGINTLIDMVNKIPFVDIAHIPELGSAGASDLATAPPGVTGLIHGGTITRTGMALVHRGETVLPANASITNNIFLDGELIAQSITSIIAGKAQLQGG